MLTSCCWERLFRTCRHILNTCCVQCCPTAVLSDFMMAAWNTISISFLNSVRKLFCSFLVYDSVRVTIMGCLMYLKFTEHKLTQIRAQQRWCQKLKVKATLRLTVGHSVSLGVEPHLGLMTRYLLLFDSYALVSVGRPLWREDVSVFYICCWTSPE
jgi:hypothetical protein